VSSLGPSIVGATRDAAKIAQVNFRLVAAGNSADIIILDANPLEKIASARHISGASSSRPMPALSFSIVEAHFARLM
jgi:hypothetical protein